MTARHRHQWTDAEKARLRTVYAAGGIHAAMGAFPCCTRDALKVQAVRLRVGRLVAWTDKEDRVLRDSWGGGLTVPGIARHLHRRCGTKRTPVAVYLRARKLGLPVGCPQGWEYLSHAAERTGYNVKQLRRILAWAGLDIRRALVSPHAAAKAEREKAHIVIPDDVDDAVARWLKAHTLAEVAQQWGTTTRRASARLRAAGLTPAGPQQWRLSAEQVRQAEQSTTPLAA